MQSQAEVEERLVAALSASRIIRIVRSPPNTDLVSGIPLAIGSKWVLLLETGDGGYFDGIVALRLKDIVKVKKDSSFESRFAQTQPGWPPTAPEDVNLDNTRSLINDLSRISPLLGIEQERRHHSSMRWIGVVTEMRDGWLRLHEVRPDATWHAHPLAYKLKSVTKVNILDRYLIALSSIAGTFPQP
jgi:hypothetical protein